MDGLAHFLEILGMGVTVLLLIAAALFFAARRLPAGHPFTELMRGAGRRINASVIAVIIGIPLQPIPEIDGIYDIGALILLAAYWYSLAGTLRSARTGADARGNIFKYAPMLLRLLANARRIRKR